MLLAGIDIGYGDVKVLLSDGRQTKFPTAVTPDPGGVLDYGVRKDSDLYAYDGSQYYVGDVAMHIGSSLATRDFKFLEAYAPLLLYAAIRQIAGNGCPPVSMISVGLPLADCTPANREALIRKLNGASVNGESLRFARIEVVPQGVGILSDVRMTMDGNVIAGTDVNTLVIDVGFNTLDVVVAVGGIARRANSGMIERAGISWICDKIVARCRERNGLNLTEHQAKEVLARRAVKVYGKTIDMNPDIDQMSADYVKWLMSQLSSRWGDNLRQFDKVVVAGGGAHHVRPHLPAEYAHVMIPHDPEFSNARGFLKRLKWVLRSHQA